MNPPPGKEDAPALCIVCTVRDREPVDQTGAFAFGMLLGVNATERPELALKLYAEACAEHKPTISECMGRQMAQELTRLTKEPSSGIGVQPSAGLTTVDKSDK